MRTQNTPETLWQIPQEKVFVIDTETTGLDRQNDEMVQLSIVDGLGRTVLNAYLKPEHRRQWKKAEQIHGISPSDVESCPHYSEIKPHVEQILADARMIVGYNLPFDLAFLRDTKIRENTIMFDVMREFAPIKGEWLEWKKDYKWIKLTECAAHYGIRNPAAHNSLHDAQTTLQCFYRLINDRHWRGWRIQRRQNASKFFKKHKKFIWGFVAGFVFSSVCFASASGNAGNTTEKENRKNEHYSNYWRN